MTIRTQACPSLVPTTIPLAFLLGLLLSALQVQAEPVPKVSWYEPYGQVVRIEEAKITKRKTWGAQFPTNADMLQELELTVTLTVEGYEPGFSKDLIAQ